MSFDPRRARTASGRFGESGRQGVCPSLRACRVSGTAGNVANGGGGDFDDWETRRAEPSAPSQPPTLAPTRAPSQPPAKVPSSRRPPHRASRRLRRPRRRRRSRRGTPFGHNGHAVVRHAASVATRAPALDASTTVRYQLTMLRWFLARLWWRSATMRCWWRARMRATPTGVYAAPRAAVPKVQRGSSGDARRTRRATLRCRRPRRASTTVRFLATMLWW